jgi:hypothetical protein
MSLPFSGSSRTTMGGASAAPLLSRVGPLAANRALDSEQKFRIIRHRYNIFSQKPVRRNAAAIPAQ